MHYSGGMQEALMNMRHSSVGIYIQYSACGECENSFRANFAIATEYLPLQLSIGLKEALLFFEIILMFRAPHNHFHL